MKIYIHGRNDLTYLEFCEMYSSNLLDLNPNTVILVSGHNQFFQHLLNFIDEKSLKFNNLYVLTTPTAKAIPHSFKEIGGFASIYSIEVVCTYLTNDDIVYFLPLKVTGPSLKSIIRRYTPSFNYQKIINNNEISFKQILREVANQN